MGNLETLHLRKGNLFLAIIKTVYPMLPGCLFLLAGIRQPDKVRQQLQAGLKSTEAKERVESLQR